MIVAKGIRKKYGNVAVLNGIDLTINSNEIVAITGDSGAGKSTLLHILGSLDRPDAGEVFINNTNIVNFNLKQIAKFRNTEMGFVFQFHHLLPEFTAQENVALPALIAGKTKSEAMSLAADRLADLGLASRLNNKPNQLSGGEQQRVSVARALINNPKIVFADEPTGNLDSKNAIELHELFIALRDKYKNTFVVVTHNLSLAKLCDRTLHVKDGLLF